MHLNSILHTTSFFVQPVFPVYSFSIRSFQFSSLPLASLYFHKWSFSFCLKSSQVVLATMTLTFLSLEMFLFCLRVEVHFFTGHSILVLLSVLVRLFVIVTNTWERQFKGGKTYFGSWFQRFQTWSAGSIAFRSVARQKHHGRRACQRRTPWACGGGQEAGNKIHLSMAWPQGPTSSKETPPPTFHSLPIIPPCYESIKGLLYWLGQTLRIQSQH
jgi:hypothetical protein